MQSKNNIIQISLLFLIQLLSITVVIINAIALKKSKDIGLIIPTDTGPQDYILLIMASASFIIISIFLCLHFPKLFPTIELSKKFQSTKIAFSILVIALWTSTTSIILSNFNSLSICRNKIIPKTILNTSSCNLVDSIIVIAFVTIGLWSLLLLTSIYTLSELCKVSFVRPLESSPIQPYENVKIQISVNNNPMMEDMHTEYDAITIIETKIHQKELLQNTTTTPPLPAILTTKLKDWNFDFQPMDIDLMLPKELVRH